MKELDEAYIGNVNKTDKILKETIEKLKAISKNKNLIAIILGIIASSCTGLPLNSLFRNIAVQSNDITDTILTTNNISTNNNVKIRDIYDEILKKLLEFIKK